MARLQAEKSEPVQTAELSVRNEDLVQVDVYSPADIAQPKYLPEPTVAVKPEVKQYFRIAENKKFAPKFKAVSKTVISVPAKNKSIQDLSLDESLTNIMTPQLD